MVPGSLYLGSYIDPSEEMDAWVCLKVEKWEEVVRDLVNVSKRHPQIASAGLEILLQLKWQYLQITVRVVGALMEPIDSALRGEFSSDLFGEEEVDDDLRELLRYGVKRSDFWHSRPK